MKTNGTPSLFDLSCRTALITGSTRGIGRALAEGLAQSGARVVLNGRQPEDVQKQVQLFQAMGFNAEALPFDVTDEVAVEAAFEDLARRGLHIDILINNAGIQHRQPMVDLGLVDWHRVINTNLTSAFLVGRAAAKRMIAKNSGGKIINIGSLTSEAARATVAPYTVAKGGIKMLSRAMAAEWAQFNIQANTIGPGYIQTEMNTDLVNNPSFDAWVKASNPAKRWGQPEELIGTAVYLSSNASNYVNGQIIYVDGGWLSVL